MTEISRVEKGMLRIVTFAVALSFAFLGGCSRAREIAPPERQDAPILASDYLQLEVVGFKLTPVTIRVYGNGKVERNTIVVWKQHVFGCPLQPQDQTVSIEPSRAARLIREAVSDGFLSWNSQYEPAVTTLDGSSVDLTLFVAGHAKRVTDHNGEPPEAFHSLVAKVEDAAPIPAYAASTTHSSERSAFCLQSEKHLPEVRSNFAQQFPDSTTASGER